MLLNCGNHFKLERRKPMTERRSWDQMKKDNDGADWIVNGEFCKNYRRAPVNKGADSILQKHRNELGLQEWQLTGFNGCWSCDKINEQHFERNKPCRG